MYLLRRKTKKKRRRKKFIKKVALFLVTVFLLVIIAGFVYLPLMVTALERDPFLELESSISFVDSEGKKYHKEYEDYRIKVPLEDVPDTVKKGFLAVEDKRFYDHFGLDFRGISRAIAANIKEWQIVEGGSTITQQLAKNYFLSQEKTFKRKANEVLYTLYIERNLSKDEIMEKYLNKIYFGHGAYGIEAASRRYFDKNVSELNLSEQAMLVGLVRSPYSYSPVLDLEAAKRRRNMVILEMLKKDFITPTEAEQARNEEIDLKLEVDRTEDEAQHFADEVINRLEKIMADKGRSIYEGGLVVHTTLDKELQYKGEDIIENNLEVKRYQETETDRIRQPQGALVAIEPGTGYVRAVVGGRDFEESRLNRANLKDNSRAMGSAFKPYVYAAALDNKYYHPAELIRCEEKEFSLEGSDEKYKPTCYGGGYHNEDFTLRRAIVESCNIAAVKINKEIGPEKSVEYARKFGIESNIQPWLSFPLGSFGVTPIELAASYIPLASKGVATDPVLIKKVEDYQGEVIYEKDREVEVVLDERAAYQLTDILKDVISPVGTAAKIHGRLDFAAAGKTGTSQGGRDASFVGYTPELITAVYVGDDENKKLEGSGGTLAAPLWADFMEFAQDHYSFGEFQKPGGIVSKRICQESGKIASFNCPEEKVVKENFLPGTKPEEKCNEHLEFPDLPFGIW